MSLKTELRNALREAKKKTKTEEMMAEKALIRSETDWIIIREYLSALLVTLAKKSRGGHWIKFDKGCDSLLSPEDSNGNRITLTDNSKLEITTNDIERFCKEEHLKLRFLLKKDGEFIVVKHYSMFDTIRSYLIKV